MLHTGRKAEPPQLRIVVRENHNLNLSEIPPLLFQMLIWTSLGLAQACPNYDSLDSSRPPAPPPAMRKGYAFPLPGTNQQPHPRRRRHRLRGGADEEKKGGDGPERRSLSAKQWAKPPSNIMIAR